MPSSSSRRRLRLGVLIALLTLATASANYLQGALSVLAGYLIDEFGVTPAQFGMTFTVFYLVGGIGSPFVGRLVDASPRAVMAALFLASIVGTVVVATARGYLWVLGGALLGGLAIAAANPVTNKLVWAALPEPRRGLAIGIKQSGPPMNLTIAGLILPGLAAALGWRTALAVTALLPAIGLVATWLVVSPGERSTSILRSIRPRGTTGRATVWWLAAMGFVRAIGGGALIAFVPLYAQRSLGFSKATAGLTASLLGLAGVAGRMFWGAMVARFRAPGVLLTVLAALAVASSATVWASGLWSGLIWFGVVGTGFSVISFLAVSWLALLEAVESSDIGWTTGVIQFGTSAGFATGPPVMGLIVGSAGGFAWGWAFVVATFVATLAMAVVWQRRVAV
jgi:predicted MFS family arabinose efflux permease